MNKVTRNLHIVGPSKGEARMDDGGDYAIVDEKGQVIGEAFRVVIGKETRPAKANALLWSKANELLAVCRDLLANDPTRYAGDPDCDWEAARERAQELIEEATDA